MIIQNRQYQNDTAAAIREGFKTHVRQIMCLPTGGGKTVVFSNIVAQAVAKGKKILILSDRTEIFKQTLKVISKHEIPICKIDRDNKTVVDNAKVYLAMCETFKRRIDRLKHLSFDLIIVDESHKKSYDPILDLYPNTFTIGATATPVPTKKYTNLVHLIDVPELIEKGFLVPCKAFELQDDISDIETKKNGDFEEKSHFIHYNKSKMYEGVIENYLAKCKGRQTLVYNVSIEHSELMTRAFNAAGIKSYSITSRTSDAEREWILKEFSAGSFPVLNNCGCLTTGTDIPICSAVIINRAISVLTLFIQIVGRGGRLCPEIGKKDFICIDHGLNHSRFGLWAENRTWSLHVKKKKNTLGAAPVKSCKACTAMLSVSTTECPYCGYLFPKDEKQLKHGILVELTNNIRSAIPGKYISQCTLEELLELEKVGQLKATYIWRVLRARGAQAIGDYAKLKEYHDTWIMRQIETLEHELTEGGVKFFDKRINEIEYLQL